MTYIFAYQMNFHECYNYHAARGCYTDTDSEEEQEQCTRGCHVKLVFVKIDEQKSPSDTSYEIYITGKIDRHDPLYKIDWRALTGPGASFQIDEIMNEHPGNTFSIRHIMKTETNECIDVEYKPLLLEIKANRKYYHPIVSKLKSKYKFEAYLNSFNDLVAILSS